MLDSFAEFVHNTRSRTKKHLSHHIRLYCSCNCYARALVSRYALLQIKTTCWQIIFLTRRYTTAIVLISCNEPRHILSTHKHQLPAPMQWTDIQCLNYVLTIRQTAYSYWLFTNPGAAMPVRRGHVAPQNTFIETIIRKFDGQREYTLLHSPPISYSASVLGCYWISLSLK